MDLRGGLVWMVALLALSFGPIDGAPGDGRQRA
jgi:hypothetical protein